MNNVRETILNSSKKLLLKNGYSKTTIREIIKDSGVLSGSIYHFFKNKEDIFKSLILELFDECENKVITSFGMGRSTEFIYALMTVIELKMIEKNERIRELYYEAYSSNLILEKIVDQGAKKSREVFKKHNPNYSLKDYYNSNLMIKGAMRSCIIDTILDEENSFEKRNNVFLKMVLTLMNMPPDKSEVIIEEINMMNVEIDNIADEIINDKFNVSILTPIK